MLGRAFTPQEDLRHGGKVLVLSYGLWQRRFGGDAAIDGKSLSLGNEPYTIVGVVGKDFVFDPEADIWLPFQFPPVSEDQQHYFLVAGMLKPGLTVVQANAQLMAAAPQYRRDFPRANPRRQFAVEPLPDSIVGGVRNSLLVLAPMLPICCWCAPRDASASSPSAALLEPTARALLDNSIIEGVLLRPLPFAAPATLVALGHVADGADSNGAPNVSASQVISLFPRHSRIRQPRRFRADRL